MRKTIEVDGALTATLSLDPEEFRGASRGDVLAEISRQLTGAPTTVQFFPEDVARAADEVLGVKTDEWDFDTNPESADFGGEG